VRGSAIPHLIIINALIWLVSFRFPGLPLLLALHKADSPHFAYWQILTYFFTHERFFHILANMLTLWSLGTTVEAFMGSGRFLRFYLITGLLTGVILAFLDPSRAPVIGASTAISGVVSAFAYYYPRGELYIFPIPFAIRVRALAIGFGTLSLILFFLNPENPVGGISHLGHLLGLIIGYLYLRIGRRL
jgi:membrane associated rhomboid family serine protease